MADTGIWEAIKGLLMGQPQSTNPQVQNLAQAGFPGAQQMTQRQGGLFGQGGPFGQPGSLMQAIAAPLAIFSAVEAARGKGVGSAYLGGLGDLLGGLGEQRQKWAEDTDTSEALLKEVNAQFPQFANDKGLQESVKGFISANPTEALKNIEGLQKHLEGQSKTKALDLKIIGGLPYIFDPTKGSLTKIPGFKATPTGQPKPSFEMAAWAKALKKDINNLTPQDMQEWQQYKSDPAMQRLAQSNMDAIQRLQLSEAAATDRQIRAEKAMTDRIQMLTAEKGGPKAPTIKGYDGAYDPDLKGWVYSPSVANTEGISTALTSGALKLFGAGNKPFVMMANSPKRYYLTETKTLKDGRTITGATIPGIGFYSAE